MNSPVRFLVAESADTAEDIGLELDYTLDRIQRIGRGQLSPVATRGADGKSPVDTSAPTPPHYSAIEAETLKWAMGRMR